jgi:hypothetical protein
MSHTTCVSDVSGCLSRVRWPRRTGQITSRSVGSVSPVPRCLAASGLQIGLQNRPSICSSRSCPTLSRGALAVITAARSAPGHRPRRRRAQAPPPNPTAAGPYGRRSKVPAGVNTPTAGSGEVIRVSTRMPSDASPIFPSCTISLGIGQIMPADAADQPIGLTLSIRDWPHATLANRTLIARRRALQGIAASGPGRLWPGPWFLAAVPVGLQGQA